jgi:hypothetical protein
VIVYDRSELHLERHDTPVGTSDDEVDFVGASVGSQVTDPGLSRLYTTVSLPQTGGQGATERYPPRKPDVGQRGVVPTSTRARRSA